MGDFSTRYFSSGYVILRTQKVHDNEVPFPPLPIAQKAVEIDGVTIDDPRKEIDLSKPTEFLLRVGKKKFIRIVVN